MDQHKQVTTNEARAGVTPHMARHVLVVSLILVVVGFAALLLIWR